jgi:hypothetical protein
VDLRYIVSNYVIFLIGVTNTKSFADISSTYRSSITNIEYLTKYMGILGIFQCLLKFIVGTLPVITELAHEHHEI